MSSVCTSNTNTSNIDVIDNILYIKASNIFENMTRTLKGVYGIKANRLVYDTKVQIYTVQKSTCNKIYRQNEHSIMITHQDIE